MRGFIVPRFVERANGVIVRSYACIQPGIAEEELADDHPELVAYLNPPVDYRKQRLEAYRQRGATETACIEAIIEHMGGRPEKMIQLAAIRDSVKRDFPKP